METRKQQAEALQGEIIQKVVQFFEKRNPKTAELEATLFTWLIPTAQKGVTWKIIPKSETQTPTLEKYQSRINAMPHWTLRKIKSNRSNESAFVLEIDKDYLYEVLDASMPSSVWGKAIKDDYDNFHKQELSDLYKDLLDRRADKKQSQNPIICIYNQNMSKYITKDKKSIRAYAVTIEELAYMCHRAGCFFVAKGIGGSYDGQKFAPAEVINPNHEAFTRKFMETLPYTAGVNAVQIQICVATQDELNKFQRNGALKN